jgi:predicted dehydrogenase
MTVPKRSTGRRFAPLSLEPSPPLRMAVVGYGYWGPNLVRNIVERPELELAALCERDEERAAAFSAKVPNVPWVRDYDDILGDPEIDAVVVATPPKTHYGLVKAALMAGKHVMVEKPLATTGADAADLVDIANARGLTLMPGHTFVYSPPVNKVRDLIRTGKLGEVYFVTSSRMNLGKYQPDGVICDLAPHDLSILLYWLDEPVVEVAATGRSVFQDHVPETAFMTLTFASGATANVQLSWLAPRKVREMVVVGSRRMVQYDDTAADEAVRVFDRGMEFSPPENFGEYQLTYRSGDMVVPRIEPAEPLSLELQDFARAVNTGAMPRSSADLGLEIVQAMDAAKESLLRNGEPVEVHRVPVQAAA